MRATMPAVNVVGAGTRNEPPFNADRPGRRALFLIAGLFSIALAFGVLMLPL